MNSERLGLGTAQWGMTYGVTSRGRPAGGAVVEMLALARAHGITGLDTAHSYGDAEVVIGELPDALREGLQIVTKTRPVGTAGSVNAGVTSVINAFALSLRRLRCDRVYGLLVHGASDLLAPAGDRLWAAMEECRARGTATRIGVSVYHPEQLDAILARYPIGLVQLPFNVYDQRFAQSGMLARLQRANIEVHARSAFLQGLLLMPAHELPAYFSPLREHQASLHARLKDLEMSPLAGCLRFCLGQPGIDKVIVGCDAPDQLAEIVAAVETTADAGLSFPGEALDDLNLIDPSRWLTPEPPAANPRTRH